MTVYINGKFLCQQTTGVQTYALAMLEALKLLHVDIQILTPKVELLTDKYQVKKTGFFSKLGLWEQLSLPHFMRKQKGAVLLNFCNSAPLLCTKQIVTIHDLAFEQKQSWFTITFRIWYRYLIPRVCQRALRIFTVSNFSKNELTKRYQIDERKIEVIPNAYPPPPVYSTRKIREDYVLLIGADNPRKNAAWVLERIAEIEQQGLVLVLLGTRTGAFLNVPEVEHPSVRTIDYVSQQDYYSLLYHCTALIYPSLYEGFGIPVLEGLSLKRPVICNDLPVFRESFGDLPIYLNLNQEKSLLLALKKSENWAIKEEDLELLKARYNPEESAKRILQSLNTI